MLLMRPGLATRAQIDSGGVREVTADAARNVTGSAPECLTWRRAYPTGLGGGDGARPGGLRRVAPRAAGAVAAGGGPHRDAAHPRGGRRRPPPPTRAPFPPKPHPRGPRHRPPTPGTRPP